MLQFKTIATTTLELLRGLQQLKSLTDTRLVGGTALALQYGHRISIDLDFFMFNTNQDFISIISEIKNAGYKIDIRKQTSKILIAMINDIKVDIVNYPYPWIDSILYEDNIIMATDKDIAAMKLSAITNRGTKKDFIDLYFLLKKYTLEELLTFYSLKYNDSSTFMVLKSLTWFEDAEIEAAPRILDQSFNWETAKSTILNQVKQNS